MILAQPGAFALRTLRAFRANQGLLLAGAVAYYALLSLVPMLIVIVIALSHVVDAQVLMDALGRYLEWVVPGQSGAILSELQRFLDHRTVLGWVLLGTMFFFSSLAFTVLENAMSIIFVHRVAIRRRHFLVSALLPYCYILFLGFGLLIVTLISASLEAMGQNGIDLLGRHWAFGDTSGVLLYLLGVGGEALLLTSIYLVMPVGSLSVRHAALGGVTATLLWEISRHVLVWYFATLSQVTVVYGSLTSAIAALLSMEIAATFLLFGAQVIAEYERLGLEARSASPEPLHTD
ncbi:MAG: YihY/virulence factor BrkB family protein [Nevskiales bacterium]|nr:YihY/virulence factor BrkB family protein [Nevskiales bacterium]